MKKFKNVILFVYILLFSNLLISGNFLSSIVIFLIPNLYFSLFFKLSQKKINQLSLIELLFWIINIYFVLVSNFDMLFLALNNLLWLLTSIKLIEVRNDLNNKNIILLLLLSLGTSSLYNTSFLSNIIHIFLLFLLIYSLLVFNKYKSKNIIKQIIILISFLPLTLISFLSIPSPKPWLRINPKTLAKTGIRDELRPGDISNLAQSQDLVARVFFSNDLPNPESRYWRVFVLDNFKNNTWISNTQYDENNLFKNILLRNKKNHSSEIPIIERWILEPNFIRQRPWSGKGNSNSTNLHITDKGVLLGRKESRKREQYQIEYTENSWREVSPKKVNFNIDEIENKLLFKLSRKWLKESSDPEKILEKAIEWFSKEDFTYSINPGVMNSYSPYDEFLFKKKKGFCEHFAGSFALLMKYANIPSRVVVGYQGGEIFNDAKDNKYILVDNSYAHAWNEIWIENKGWIRVDPTSWVAPERIQQSLLLTKNHNPRFKNFTRNINHLLISNLTKLEIKFTDIKEKIRLRLRIVNFSKNIIFNRIYNILFFLSVLFLSIISLLLLELRNEKGYLREILNIYLYLLNLFKLKRRKGETLKSISLRVKRVYPEIAKEINKIYIYYNRYKFRTANLSKQKLLVLYFKLTYYQIIVLTHISLKNLKLDFIKSIKSKK